MAAERRVMHFILRDGRKAAVLIGVIEYATAWKLATSTSLKITIAVEDEDGNVKDVDICEFERLRVNGFASQQKGL